MNYKSQLIVFILGTLFKQMQAQTLYVVQRSADIFLETLVKIPEMSVKDPTMFLLKYKGEGIIIHYDSEKNVYIYKVGTADEIFTETEMSKKSGHRSIKQIVFFYKGFLFVKINEQKVSESISPALLAKEMIQLMKHKSEKDPELDCHIAQEAVRLLNGWAKLEDLNFAEEASKLVKALKKELDPKAAEGEEQKEADRLASENLKKHKIEISEKQKSDENYISRELCLISFIHELKISDALFSKRLSSVDNLASIELIALKKIFEEDCEKTFPIKPPNKVPFVII